MNPGSLRDWARRLHPDVDLGEMVTQVRDVVFGQERQRHRLIPSHGAADASAIGRNAPDHVHEMTVIGMPQAREIAPRAFDVRLTVHPMVLRVGRRDELGTLLTDRTGERVFTLGPKRGI